MKDELKKLKKEKRALRRSNAELQFANEELEQILNGIVRSLLTQVGDGDSIFDKSEVHENCRVEIWTNSKTGEQSFGWTKMGE